MPSKRLDVILVERGLAATRELAQSLILSGNVWSGGRRLDKAGAKIDEAMPLEVRVKTTPFASRAGQKLQFGLDAFGIAVEGRVCLDVGVSTGGFTDCLLQRGARVVFGVDVGYGQIELKLRNDPRVVLLERTNARFLTRADLRARHEAATAIDFLCIDVSFISVEKVLEPLSGELPTLKDLVVLFKPQFEVGREHVGKGGLVRDETAVKTALERFHSFMETLGFRRAGGPESSPVAGKKSGNVEYLIHYEKTSV
jgi:23S rRNA (cytidine1920-2'-O)/16S rRNA (cytidine1409-2'-O)-methyltransferase